MIPFPQSRWCYGIDVYWAVVAQKKAWRMGIVDATPIGHLRPVAKAYDAAGAITEGRELLARFGVSVDRKRILDGGRIALAWRR